MRNARVSGDCRTTCCGSIGEALAVATTDAAGDEKRETMKTRDERDTTEKHEAEIRYAFLCKWCEDVQFAGRWRVLFGENDLWGWRNRWPAAKRETLYNGVVIAEPESWLVPVAYSPEEAACMFWEGWPKLGIDILEAHVLALWVTAPPLADASLHLSI